MGKNNSGAAVFSLLVVALLAWGANREADLAGYNVYCYSVLRDTLMVVDVGLDREFDLDVLDAGSVYFLNVSAYDESGNESGLSESAVYAVAEEAVKSDKVSPSGRIKKGKGHYK